MKIIVDSREKNSLVISELAGKIEVELKKLAVADYLVGNIAIERKTARDFVSSMINKRLLRQLEEIKQYPKQLIIIEGLEEYFSEADNKLHPNAVRGMLLSIIFDFDVPIIFTKDYEDTASFLLLLMKKFEKGKKEISLRAKKKVYSMAEQQQLILEGFPGIGPSIAKKLLRKFKTIKKFINAKEKELSEIKKLNKNKIRAIKNIIDKEYKIN